MAYLVKLRVNFNLRDPRSPDATPIVMVLRWGGERQKFPTGQHATEAQWHMERQRIDLMKVPKDQEERARRVNDALDELEARAKDKFEAWRSAKGRPPERSEMQALLRERIDAGTEVPVDLWSVIEDMIQDAPKRMRKDGRPMHKGLQQHYITTRDKLKAFERSKDGMPATFDAINTRFYRAFVKFLADQGLYANAIGKYIKTVKAFIHEAQRSGAVIPGYMPKQWVKFEEEADDIALTLPELKAIEALDLSERPALANARDILLMGCWCPVRYGDLRTLTTSRIGRENIVFDQEKVGREVTVPRLRGFNAVLQRRGGKLPEFISDQRLNDHLKDIAKMVPGMDREEVVTRKSPRNEKPEEDKVPRWKMVSTHTMRRTGATNFYRLGVPTLSIMKITGHRSEKAFLRYVKVDAEEHAAIAKRKVEEALMEMEKAGSDSANK